MSENGGQVLDATVGDPVGAGAEAVTWAVGELRTVWTPQIGELDVAVWEFVAVLEDGYEGWCLFRYLGDEGGLVSNEALWEANKLLVSEMADQAVTIRELREQVGDWRVRWLEEHTVRLDEASSVQAATTIHAQFEALREQLTAAEEAADEAETRAAWAWDLLGDVQQQLSTSTVHQGMWTVSIPAALADFIADGIKKGATYEAETGEALTLYERHRLYRLAYDLLVGDGHATREELVAALWPVEDVAGRDEGELLAMMAAYEAGEEDLYMALVLLVAVQAAIYEGEHVPGGVEVALRGDVVADLKHGAGGDRRAAVQAAIDVVAARCAEGEEMATGGLLVQLSSGDEDLVAAAVQAARGVLWAATGEAVFAPLVEDEGEEG